MNVSTRRRIAACCSLLGCLALLSAHVACNPNPNARSSPSLDDSDAGSDAQTAPRDDVSDRGGMDAAVDGSETSNDTDEGDTSGSDVECTTDEDCESNVCNVGECAAPTCEDEVQNGGETDVDCGGSECDACDVGDACESNEDCTTGVCGSEGTCRRPTCSDGVENGEETGVDCGGPECDACDVGASCESNADCVTGVCGGSEGTCQNATCEDDVQNGEETDTDCGGPDCDPCDNGSDCSKDRDCESGVCQRNQCVPPSCGDRVQNGEETDTDCGGSNCSGCSAGRTCSEDADCRSGVCDGGTCRAPTCSDGVQNGRETDVDCGGPACGACASGASCRNDRDCQSSVCKTSQQGQPGTCQQASCSDGVKNGQETAVDCGGPQCSPCQPGEVCQSASDCASGVCKGGACAAASCSDGVENGRETDVDCGGPRCASCLDGDACQRDDDCQSRICEQGSCQQATCSDGVQNQDESDVDCGGSACSACKVGASCNANGDCQSSVCQGEQCVTPTCGDRVQNGRETDVDCGGPQCSPCPKSANCKKDRDCQSKVCKNGSCTAPTCSDGVQNGRETDVDCGGPNCSACAVGEQCRADGDCQSGVCNGGTCDAPDCTDRVQNGSETDVDCGGSTCGGCSVGASCQSNSDCASNVCAGGSCAICANGDTRATARACGYKNRGRVYQTCKNYKWTRDSCRGVWFASCKEILDAKPKSKSGQYTIDPDGPNGNMSPRTVRCDMQTDGGGWTRLIRWDRENNGDTKADLRKRMIEEFNNMGIFEDRKNRLHWEDANNRHPPPADLLAYKKLVDVPNGGEARLSIHYDGVSMEDSGTFAYVHTQAGTDRNLICAEDLPDWRDGGDDGTKYNPTERSFAPRYQCPNNRATGTYRWDKTIQKQFASPLDSFSFRSFHSDDGGGDYSDLYRFEVWVR